MKVVYAGEEFEGKGSSIFLAGFTPRIPTVPSCRPQATDWLVEVGGCRVID